MDHVHTYTIPRGLSISLPVSNNNTGAHLPSWAPSTPINNLNTDASLKIGNSTQTRVWRGLVMTIWVNWNMFKFFQRKVISLSETINAAAMKPSLRTLPRTLPLSPSLPGPSDCPAYGFLYWPTSLFEILTIVYYPGIILECGDIGCREELSCATGAQGTCILFVRIFGVWTALSAAYSNWSMKSDFDTYHGAATLHWAL